MEEGDLGEMKYKVVARSLVTGDKSVEIKF